MIGTWERRARAAFPAVGDTSRPELVDSMPILVDQIATRLAGAQDDAALAREQERVAARHGLQRSRLEQYDVELVVAEYQLLQQILLDHLDELDRPSNGTDEKRRERDIVLDSVNCAVAKAIAFYVASVRDAAFTREAELHHLVEAVTDYAIMMLDPQGFFTTWNRGAERIEQWPAEEAVGRHFSILYRTEDLWKPPNELKRALETGRCEDEGWRMRKDGSLFWASVIITPIWDEGRLRGFSKVSRDITHRAEMEEELRRNVSALRDERDLRQRFVMTLAHDLRTPLTTARLTADAMLRAPERGDARDERARHVQRIAKSLARSDEMIQDLLDAYVIEGGKPLQLTVDECDLVPLAREVVEDANSVHPGRVVLDADEGVRGVWSGGQLRRVMDNLVNNALKYGATDTPVTVSVKATCRGERVRISVNNRGPVIPPAQLPKLFLPFHRVATGSSAAGSQPKRGWGIGLSLVKGIAEAHGGHVFVESNEQNGTTFTVELPQRAAVEALATGTR